MCVSGGVSALDHAECQDAKYDRTFSFSANPHPWLTLENDEINFYIYQGATAIRTDASDNI